ncbi:DUF1418 family protein [Serratia microhaemolytica]|uniref:DUF1418 family protein n=1 Tax=Serratia microhaemolytica TaxID=2675110 RepID=UPI000FDEA5E2|nr:DUF1418 family protein [Serratia microhaemolytica]
MRSLSQLPRLLLWLEALGLLLLMLAYLNSRELIVLPGILATPLAAIVMIFFAIALMLPAATVLVWRTVQGSGEWLQAHRPPSHDKHRAHQQQQQVPRKK